jgi:filamentous hemagglutinin family protein
MSMSIAPLNLRPLVLALAAASLLPSLAAAQTLPSGMTVVHGGASVATTGNTMTVTNTNGAVLNWSSFSIGNGQAVRFQQPDANSQVLNRVLGTNPSQIFGTLSSNGRVWLLNPNGVLFGRDARVDVAGLVASSLNLADGDWLAGRYRLSAPSGVGADVSNAGEIRTTSGGRVLLLAAGNASNTGLIDAPSGQVALAAGRSVEVVDSGTPNLTLVVTAPLGEVLNLGSVSAAGGRIDLQGGIVNQQGVLRADALESGPGGAISLRGHDVSVATGSLTSATGASGGTVVAQAEGGQTLVDGRIDASGVAGSGGAVRLLGQQVGLMDHATVQASGATGGGTVFVGGGAQGQDASVPNAQATYMSATASIAADATGQGAGGHIVLWSDKATRAYGRFSARGGAQGGDGGLVETSGGWLDARPAALDVSTRGGRAGEWLLDPNNILISDTISTDSNVTGGPNFTTTNDAALLSTSSISTALSNGTSVTITTGSAGGNTQAGDITLSQATIVSGSNRPVSLTLRAAHDISISLSSIVGSAQPLSVDLGAAQGGSGGVTLSSSSISTNGGSFKSSGTSFNQHGSSIDLGAGKATVRADTVLLDPDAGLSSTSGGNSIVISGFSSGFVTSFESDAATTLRPSGGRWLVYATDPSVVIDGGLTYTFVAYGGPAPASLPDTTNNGFVYSQAPTLSLSTSTTPTKTYDQRTLISLAGTGLSVTGGVINGDQVTVSSLSSDLFGNFSDANAGTGKAIAVNPGAVGASDRSGHVVYGYALAPVSGNIDPLAISASGTTSNKVYDGTTAASVNWSLSGVLSGDTVSAVPGSAQFADRNVGTNKSVTANVTLAGAQAGNYTVGSASASPADITPLAITATGTPADKVYDGTTAATVSWALSGAIAGDTLSVSSTGDAFSDRNVGTGKTVTVSSLALDGVDAGNYLLGGSSIGTANITPRAVTATGTTSNKVYDGTTAATVAWSLGGVVSGDSVSLVPGAANFGDRNAGVNKTVSAGGTLGGADAGNYTLSSATASNADITPKPVSASGTTSDKVYDGSTAATVSGWTLSGVLAGDSVSVAATGAQFSDRNVGTNKAVSATGVLSGADAGNYQLSALSPSNASITPATLTYVADPREVFAGQALPALTGTVTGFVGGDTLASATTGALGFSTPAGDPPASAGVYAIDGGGLGATNYVFAQAASNATALTVDVAPQPVTAPTNTTAATNATVTALSQGVQAVQPAPQASPSAPLVDAFQAVQPNPQTGQASFTALPYESMSADSVAALLAARQDYKRSVLATAITELEQNPGLADLPGCQTAEQLDTGNCLLTEQLKRQLEAQGMGSNVAIAPGAVAAPSQPAHAAAPAATPKPAVAPAVASLPARVRPVVNAALPEIRRKVAVVIGIDGYSDRQIPRLDNAVNDARALGKTFEGRLGYETVVLSDASRESIVATLNRLALSLQPQDSVVVYYAGHGELVQSTGLGYWLPSNADSQNPRTWLSNADIGKLLAQFDASQVALISDSCYSGSLVAGERIGPSTQALDPKQVLTRKAAVAMSSGGNEPVADSGKQGHSPFAWSLMQSLDPLQGWQTGGNVFERVRFAVARELPQRPKYGAAPFASHQVGSDYLFERRQLAGE